MTNKGDKGVLLYEGAPWFKCPCCGALVIKITRYRIPETAQGIYYSVYHRGEHRGCYPHHPSHLKALDDAIMKAREGGKQ
jgi:hypothetical protein